MAIRITLVEGGSTRTFDFDGSREFKIGRGPRCDIVLDTSKASRYHASIVPEAGKFFVIDNESRNGTYLNGGKITRCQVDEGDVIQIGRALIAFGQTAELAAALRDFGGDETPPVDVDGNIDGHIDADDDRKAIEPTPPTKPANSKPDVSPVAVVVVLTLVVAVGIGIFLGSGGEKKSDTSTTQPTTIEQPGTDAVADTSTEEAVADSPVKPLDIEKILADSPLPPDPPTTEENPDTTDVSEAVNPTALMTELLRDAARRATGDEIVAELREMVDRHPNHPAADQAREIITIIGDVQTDIHNKYRRELKEIIDGLEGKRRFGDAARFSRILARHEALDNEFVWQRAADDLEARARTEFEEFEHNIEVLLKNGQTVEAFATLKKARLEFGGTEFFDQTVNDHLASLFSNPEKPAEQRPDVERVQLQDRAAIAFENCRFVEIAPAYWSMLAHDISDDQRLLAMEWIVKGAYMTRMFDDFLERSKGIEIQVSPLDRFKGRTIATSGEGVEFELDIDGRRAAYRDTIKWAQVSYLQKTRLFESVALSASGTVGLALFSFQAGNEESAHKALLRLHKDKSTRATADAVLAWHLEEPVPKGGFVEYRSRLVTPLFRDTELAAAATLEKQEREAREELRRVKKETKLGKYLEIAHKHRMAGRFGLNRTILASLARHFPHTEPGRKAMALVDSPILLIRSLRTRGPSSNRFDLHVLAEGYEGDDRSQAAFLNTATAAINLMFTHEPFREYESFFNVHAVHLSSKESGVDREPGSVEVDSALDGKVEWDAFVVSRNRTRSLLKEVTPETFDGQSIVIGNVSAGVATGGRGIASIPKTSLAVLAHEMGHAIADLHDEYSYAPGTRPDRNADLKNDPDARTHPMPPNLMYGSDRKDIVAKAAWRAWIDAGESRWWNGMEVSAYPGGNRTPFNTWRPQPNCKMRTSSAPFCVVCMEAMMKSIYKHVKPIDAVEPTEKNIVLYEFEVVDIKAYTLRPRTHHLDAKWKLHLLPSRNGESETLDGERILTPTRVRLKKIYRHRMRDQRMLDGVLLRGQDLRAGRHRLSVTVSDPTPWILNSARNTLAQTHEWFVDVRPGPRPEEAREEAPKSPPDDPADSDQ